jgi:molecular chaperone HtpG
MGETSRMSRETFTFQTEVNRLLDIVAHSLYSHKEIFLRELISNASDACDRLRYAAITRPELVADDPAFKIRINIDKEGRTLTVVDNGIGMNHEDLVENLGTIARSGTQAFLTQLSGDAKKDMALIGQFGVGFYSAFMVSDKVEVVTRRAGEAQAWTWVSDGKGQFAIEEGQRDGRGSTVIVHLKDGEDEFLDPARIRLIVKKYSDHIGVPIVLGDGDKEETINTGSSLWTRPKKDITQEQYKELYHHVGHTFDDPWLIIHNAVEGVVSYTSLLFIPTTPPFDLFHPERKTNVRLYVKRVFITDNCEGLIPSYLRFLRGVVDSEDLPLNISREMFQHDPRLAKMRAGIVKRVLEAIARKASEEAETYETFWSAFGSVLKEGIYEDYENRERLLSLARFRSTAGDALVSLDQYVERMKEGQEAIYTISGEEVDALRRSPQLEGFKARGVEVLLLTDPVDEFWIPSVGRYKEKPFKSAAGAGTDLAKIARGTESDSASEETPEQQTQIATLIAVLKDALGDRVKDVRASERLTESAVCLVAAEGEMDMYMERLLKSHRQLDPGHAMPRILEINPQHSLIRRLASLASARNGGRSGLTDAALLLLDQARILEGEPVMDAPAFARRMAAMIESGLDAAPAPLPGSGD